MTVESGEYQTLLKRTRDLVGFLRERLQDDPYVMVVSHHDADGLTSASIVGSMLVRAGARFAIRVAEDLRPSILDEIRKVKADLFIFSDIGSGYLDFLKDSFREEPLLLLDHHQPKEGAPSNIHQLNPHDFGIDGAKEISAATVCYLFAREFSSLNVDLSVLAVVGALGDMQDKNKDKALLGMNAVAVEDGVKSGDLSVESDLLLYGRSVRPVHRALASTTTPYLPNLSGREDNCLTLLTTHGVKLTDDGRFRTLADLTQEEKQTILNAIISYQTSLGFQSNVVLDLVGTVYTLTGEAAGSPTRDAREYSSLLNGCGRTGNPSLGVSIGLGDRASALEEANKIMTDYRRALASCMDWITRNPNSIQKLKIIWVVRGEDQIAENMTGAISSILSSSGSLSQENPIIVLARSKEGGIKLSARANERLVKSGVNLGLALSEAAKRYSGFGGGHDIAAGAYVNLEDPSEFLECVDKIITEQVRDHPS